MKALIVMVSSTWKFAATFPVAVYLLKMSFFETILFTNIGGLAGIIIFSLFSKSLINLYDTYWPRQNKKRTVNLFSRRNRRIILLKNKLGLPGIVIFTPVLLSIPVGAFLITKYFGRRKICYLYLLAGQITWSFIYTFLFTKVNTVI